MESGKGTWQDEQESAMVNTEMVWCEWPTIKWSKINVYSIYVAVRVNGLELMGM